MDSVITSGNIIDDTDSAKVAHAKAAKIETTQTSRTTHTNAPSIEDGADAALVMSLEPTIAKSSNMSQMPSWECVACTYVNDNILGLACEMCQTEKPLPGASKPEDAIQAGTFVAMAPHPLSIAAS